MPLINVGSEPNDGTGDSRRLAGQKLNAFVPLIVKNTSLTTPPTSPSVNDRYVIPVGATGDWADKAGAIACYQQSFWNGTSWDNNGGWMIFSAEVGMTATLATNNSVIRFDGTEWKEILPSGGFPTEGIPSTDGTLDQFENGADGDNIWHTEGRDLKCQNKRAMVGHSTADGNTLSINYANDFEWLEVNGKIRTNLILEHNWPGIELRPAVPNGFGYIDFIKHDRPDQDFQFRFRSDANSEQIVFEHYDENDVYSHIFSLTSAGDIWSKSYGWLHERFQEKTILAWAVFNGAGAVTLIDGFNVSGITDNATGDYTIHFFNPLPSTTYGLMGSVASDHTNSSAMPIIKASSGAGAPVNKTVNQCQILINHYSLANTDRGEIYVAFFG